MRKRFYALVIATALLIGLFMPMNAQAAHLEEGRTMSVDLDGDGKKEKVSYRVQTISENLWKYRISIYVNGKRTKVKNVQGRTTMYIVDVNKKDKKKELFIQLTGNSHTFMGMELFQYGKGKWKQVGSLKHDPEVFRRFYGVLPHSQNGKVYLEMESYGGEYVGQSILKQAFELKNKKLKPVAQQTYTCTDSFREWQFEFVTNSLKLYRDKNCKSPEMTLKYGQKFYIQKVMFDKRVTNVDDYLSGRKIVKMYIKTSSGKKGWIKVPNYKFYVDENGSIPCWG